MIISSGLGGTARPLAALSLAALAPACRNAPQQPTSPNILFILADEMRRRTRELAAQVEAP